MAMLIDEWMPAYDAVEHHRVRIAAPRERVWAEARRLDLGRAPVIRGLMMMRSLPSLFTAAGRRKVREGMVGGVLRAGFVILGERPGGELLLGVVGKFWQPAANIAQASAEEIRTFDRPGFAVATWNFVLVEDGDGTILSTETRVRCTDPESRRKFLRYWRIVGPFSALIRRVMLQSIRRAVESSSSQPTPAMAASERP